MITTKELRYVGKQDLVGVPMPGVEYSTQALSAMSECHNMFNEKYKGKQYSMIFSDSEELDFEIQDKNLLHMLGIDYKKFKESEYEDFRKQVLGTQSNDFTSYDLLNMILEKAKEVAEYDNNPANRIKALNYYKLVIKAVIFSKFSDFSEFNFGAINYIGNDTSYNYNDQKYLFIPSNEAVAPYFMMLIKQRDDSSSYCPMSLIAINNPEMYFKNQEVIIPTQILVSDNDDLSKMIATPKEKIDLINMYTSIINKYGIPNKLNIFGDYEAMLNESQNRSK